MVVEVIDQALDFTGGRVRRKIIAEYDAPVASDFLSLVRDQALREILVSIGDWIIKDEYDCKSGFVDFFMMRNDLFDKMYEVIDCPDPEYDGPVYPDRPRDEKDDGKIYDEFETI